MSSLTQSQHYTRGGRRRLAARCLPLVLIIAAAAAVVGAPGAAGATVPAAGATAAPAVASGTATIAVDATTTGPTVAKEVLGHAYLWQNAGLGSFDVANDSFYGSFIDQLNVMQPGSLRYPGGTTAEVFHWQRAVGPQAQRTPNATQPTAEGPSDSTVGPDEFGHLLDVTGATGIGTANFGTGTAAEAAGFVAYMTGAPGTSVQADERVANGHADPYNVPEWEVGNEEAAGAQIYWRGSTAETQSWNGTIQLVSFGPNAPASLCSAGSTDIRIRTCLYIYGGTTHISNQPVVGYANWNPNTAPVATGAENQTFYVKYPPVKADTDSVMVGSATWHRVTSLTAAGPNELAYTIDDTNGEIVFGDGVHGAIPPEGATITATYTSGPHDGFNAFYAAMKAANPNIKVCSTNGTDDFYEVMGSQPYDCAQVHPYISSVAVPNNLPIESYEDEMMAAADAQAATVAQTQAAIRDDAGRNIPLALTEYGQLLSSTPDGVDAATYQQSLDEALVNASQLADWIRLGIPVADRQLLTGAVQPDPAIPLKRTAAIGTSSTSASCDGTPLDPPGPCTVLEATGEVYSLFAPLAGGTVLSEHTVGDPTLPNAGPPDTKALSVLAVRQGTNLDVVAINRSTTDDVPTQIALGGATPQGPATYRRLDGESSLSFNTPADPDAVSLATGSVDAGGNTVYLNMPAHSVTMVQIPVTWTQANDLAVSLGQPAGPFASGDSFTATATVTNSGSSAVAATLNPYVPYGLTVSPATSAIQVPAGGAATVDLHVQVGAQAPEEGAPLDAVVSVPDLALTAVGESIVPVRHLRSWTTVSSNDFESQTVNSPPTGYQITNGGFVVTQSPPGSGSGKVLEAQRLASTTGQISAKRPLAATSPDIKTRFTFRVWADQTNSSLGVLLLDADGNPAVRLSLGSSGNIAQTDNDHMSDTAHYTAGRWYTIELDLDPVAATYNLYVDDVYETTYRLNAAAGAPAALRLQMPASAVPGTYYIDDISYGVENWEIVSSNDFESQTRGDVPSGYVVAGPNGGFTVVGSPSGSGNALAAQRASDTTAAISATRPIAATSASVRSRFVFQVWAKQTTSSLGVQLLDADGNPVVRLSLGTTANIARTDDDVFVGDNGFRYAPGSWYTIELDIDPTAGTYEMYVNDIFDGSLHLNAGAGTPAQIRFQMPGTVAAGTYDIDNISYAVAS